jgi:hypothetical protein
MIKTFKINNNYDVNENNYTKCKDWNIEPYELFDEWTIYLKNNEDKILSNLIVDIDDITKDEIDVFYKIFCDMMINKLDDFFTFYTIELIKKCAKCKKQYYKLDINFIIDKYITKKIKEIDIVIYNKFIGNNKRISNDLIILLINDIWMPEDDTGYFNIDVLQFKKRISNIYYLNCIHKYINASTY